MTAVYGVISSDAEHATLMSYASKRKYKLDLSSLHEDCEDDDNAEIIVVQTSLKVVSLELVRVFRVENLVRIFEIFFAQARLKNLKTGHNISIK